MRNKILKILLIIICILVGVIALIGCSPVSTVVLPKTIRVENTKIYLAPDGVPSQFQLQPIIAPENATDKRVKYSVSVEDSQYLNVDNNGLVVAKKIKEATKNPDDGIIIITITSVADSTVKTIIKAYVESVPVKSIGFTQSEIIMQMRDEPLALIPTFQPYHAVIGRNLEYTSLNPNIATVDPITGVITPVAVGFTSIEARTPKDVLGNFVSKIIGVRINYAPLRYELRVLSSQQNSVFNQIQGQPEDIEMVLNQLDGQSDPNPDIKWYIDNEHIQGIDGLKGYTYTPEDLPPGKYAIRVVLTDKTGQKLEINTPQPLRIYYVNEGFDIDIIGQNQDFKVNDTIQLEIKLKQDQYPPESYDWYLKEVGDTAKGIFLGSANTTKFSYTFTKPGEFILTAEAVIKGVHSAVVNKTEIVSIGVNVVGNDINGVTVDGTNVDGENRVYIKWDALAYDSDYLVEIKKESGVITVLDSTSSQYSQYFTKNGVILPTHIASLSDTFSVRVSGKRYQYTQAVKYNANISQGNYIYLNTIFAGYNRLVVSMEELGEMLNYIYVFRPQEIANELIPNAFDLTIFVPFLYSSLDSQRYPAGTPSKTLTPEQLNLFQIISAAINAYSESGSVNLTYEVGGGGEFVLTLKYAALPTFLPDTGNTLKTNAPFIKHYTATPRIASNNQFIIDNSPITMQVSTSNQLYLAASLGARPIAAAGSIAESVYLAAQKVLNRIISNDMTDAEKVHAIYDYLTIEVVYDEELLELSQSQDRPDNLIHYQGFHLEGVFLKNKAVCDGIAKAFTLLARIEGIQANKITGSSQDVGHAWNKVLVEGQWYIVDATWGGTISSSDINLELQSHRYLLINDAEIAYSHKTLGTYPASSDNSYEIYYNVETDLSYNNTIDDEQEMHDYITKYLIPVLNVEINIWIEIKISPSAYDRLSNAVNFASEIITNAMQGTGAEVYIYSSSSYDSNLLYIHFIR